MNDPVLNRKMFRHAAQIKHNQIPKLQQGGAPWYSTPAGLKGAWQAGPGRHLWDFSRGGGYNTAMLAAPWKKGQLAWGVGKTAVKAGMPYVKKGLQKTGIARLFREATGQKPSFTGTGAHYLAKKFPKTYGATKMGVGGAFVGMGAKTMYEGAREKDPGKVALGAGEALIGPGIFTRGRQLFNFGKTLQGGGKGTKEGIEAFKKSTKMKKGWEKSKLSSGLLSMPLLFGGAATMKDPETGAAVQLSDDEQNLIMNIAQKVALEAGANEITQEHVDQAVQIWQTDFAVREGQTGVEGDYDRGNPNEMNILTAETIPPSGGTPLNEDEAAILEAQKLKDAETQAKVLKEEFNSADLGTKDKFLKFRNQITDLTGAQGNDRDLLLMKLASGMMSIKSGEKGLKGFLDVVGQSTGPVVDTAIALNQSQRAFDKDLAIAFLKAQEDNKPGAQKVIGDVKHVMVDDPDALYGKRVLEVREDEYGQWLMQTQNPDGTIAWIPFQGQNPRSMEVSGTTQHKMRTKLSSAATGLQYVNYVLSAPDEVLGWEGGWKLITEDYKGAMDSYQSYENKYTQGMSMGNYIDNTILAADNLDTREVKVGGVLGIGKEKMTHAEWIQREYGRDMEAARAEVMKEYNGKVSQQQLDQLMQVALIETRLKYIIANANKHEDRLTKWDIEAAAERTGALGIIPRPFKNQNVTAKTIKSAYRALQAQLIGNFNTDANNYLESGGNSAFLESFVVIPYINQWKMGNAAKQINQAETADILTTIPVPGE